MKEISIKSKIVGRAVDSTTASKGGAMPVDLSAYLPKAVWEKVFKLVTDEAGNEHLFANLPFASKYGITMFADDGSVSLPDLYEGLPIDGVTLVRDDKGVLKVNPDIKLGGVDAEYVDKRINALINGAPAAFDTLKEIADVLSDNVDSIGDIITTLGTKADKAIKISAGTGLSGGGTLDADRTLSLATSGVTAGTYKSVTVDKYGRVTSGTNPTTLEGYGITDAYTKSAVDTLLGNYVTLSTKQDITGEKNFTGGLKVNGSPIVYDATNKYWKLEGDLLVTGGVTMYASDSTFKPSTIMDGVVVDGVTIRKNPTSGALEFIGSINGGVASSVDWDNVENKPSWIGSSKPVYSWNEITSKPTFASVATSGKYSDLSGVPTLLSSFTNDLGFVDASALDGYLPLNGGTLNGSLVISNENWGTPLTINRHNSYGNSVIKYTNSNDGLLGYIGVGGSATSSSNVYQPVFNDKNNTEYRIYHSGNLTPTEILTQLKTVDGSGSGLDADLLDGLQPSELYVAGIGEPYTGDINFKNNHKKVQLIQATNNGAANGFAVNYSCGLSVVGTYGGWQMITYIGGSVKNPYFRLKTETNEWHDWKVLAFTTDNVASATKLQTPRTIWGQSFDGTADVSGDLAVGEGDIYIRNARFIRGHITNGVSIPLMYFSSENNLVIGNYVASGGYDTTVSGNNLKFKYGVDNKYGIILNSSGNVLIGTTTDDGYKLRINGATRIDNYLYLDNDMLFLRKGTSTINLSANGGALSFNIGGMDFSYSKMLFTNSGNLLIGTTTDSGYKLDVNGSTRINGIPIYKSQDDVLYIDGNLAVRGGITMYATDAIDVPSIINALPVASTSSKGIASFNPSDFAVNDGVVSYVGKSGVDESVLANYAKKTDLNAYLPLAGGRVTGQIEYNFDKGYGACSVPAAGVLDTDIIFTNGAFNKYKSFLGNVHYTPDNSWYNVISVRADNSSDLYGMYLVTSMTDSQDNLKWNRQAGYNGTWQGERVILDSVNWSQYVTAADGGSYLPLSGGTLTGSLVVEKIHLINTCININRNASSGTIYDSNKTALEIEATTDLSVLRTYNVEKQATIVLHKNGNIGVNKYNPITQFDISGWAAATGCQFTYNGTGTYNKATITCNATYGLEFEASNQTDSLSGTHLPIFFGWRGGLLGMRLENGGNLLVAGGITMYSDIRKKTKLQDVELTLKQVANAPLIEHYYNSDENRTTHVGSIAQYWYGLNDWFCKKDSEGFLTMEIQNAALASAISIARELQRYESKTDKKIRLLKKRVSELEEEIEKLKLV